MINKVILVGRLGQDAKIISSKNGRNTAVFSIATSERKRQEDGTWKEYTEWHEIIQHDPLATALQSYLKKGKLVYLEGKMTLQKWEDKDKISHSRTKIICTNIKILDIEKKVQSDSGAPQTITSIPRSAVTDDLPFYDSEVPF